MRRRLTLIDAMGIGPAWYPRGVDPASVAEHTEEASEPAPVALPAPTMPHAERATPESARPTAALAPIARTVTIDWDALQQQVASCRACALCETRKHTVFGRGNPHAKWLLVGEAPGEQEDAQGAPFVGRAGRLLDNMLAAAGLDREQDVYICNVLKCRPPANRNPQADEIAACADFLQAQIRHIQPDIILALGRFAAQTLLGSQEPIGRLRGRVHDCNGIPLVASFHPAYLLRSPGEKARAWQDLLLAKSSCRQ